jgi:hypothetical protein
MVAPWGVRNEERSSRWRKAAVVDEFFSVQQALGVAFTVALKQQPWRQPING